MSRRQKAKDQRAFVLATTTAPHPVSREGHPGKRNCNRPNQRWNQVSDSERVQRVGRFVVAEHIIIAG